jgi:hypothetical protein
LDHIKPKKYSPIPVLKRCQVRTNKVWGETKTIAKVEDLDQLKSVHSAHLVPLKPGRYRRDTYGNITSTPINLRKPINIASFYHYGYKSRKEIIIKRKRGRADTYLNSTSNVQLLLQAEKGVYLTEAIFDVYDKSPWIVLTERVPKYAYYDRMMAP